MGGYGGTTTSQLATRAAMVIHIVGHGQGVVVDAVRVDANHHGIINIPVHGDMVDQGVDDGRSFAIAGADEAAEPGMDNLGVVDREVLGEADSVGILHGVRVQLIVVLGDVREEGEVALGQGGEGSLGDDGHRRDGGEATEEEAVSLEAWSNFRIQ
jgi:hypothetical protein